MKKNKWALISGASSGIGWATATTLAKQGYNLYLLGRRESRLRDLQKSLAVESRLGVFDINDVAARGAFFQNEAVGLKNLDLLVNNAGLARGTEKLQDGQAADWDAMIDTNIKSLLSLTRAVLPGMIERKTGHIVNLGSVAGRWTYPGGAVYCATKFAVRALTEGLRMDLQGTGVRVTNIEPGMVQTEFSRVRFAGHPEADKMAESVYQGMIPLSAEDIAETILWCVNRPAHLNIQEVVIFPTDQSAVGPTYVHRRIDQ